MKKIILVISILLFNIGNSQDISFAINEDFNNIVKTLFEGELINGNECKWKLNLSEKFQFKTTDSDSLYTTIDTVFTIKEFDKRIKFIITTSNSKYESCHACSPSLGIIKIEYDDEVNKIKVKDFKKFVTKYGSWGEPGEVSLLQIGENEFSIKVTSNYSGMGMTTTSESIFYEGEKILSYNSYEDNSGTTDDNSRIYKYTNSITVDKNYQITLTKKGTDINQLTGKAVKVISSSKYNFINGELVKIYKTRNIHK